MKRVGIWGRRPHGQDADRGRARAELRDKPPRIAFDVVGADPGAAAERTVAEPGELFAELGAHVPLAFRNRVRQDVPAAVPDSGAPVEDAALAFLKEPARS